MCAPAEAAPPFFLFVSEGYVRARDARARYLTPSGRGLWAPGPAALEPHGIATAFVFDAAAARRLPRETQVVRPGALLAALLGHVAETESPSAAARGLLVEQLRICTAEPLALPELRSARARQAAAILAENPGERISLAELARYAGASARTLERAFAVETGWTFERWRQQLRLLVALERLAEGAAVAAVALEAGYDSTSAFIAMFRRLTGATPRRFLAG